MCEIGEPLEVIDSQPLSPPAALRWETEQPVTVEIPVAEEVPVAEGATVSPVAGTEGTAFPLF